MATQEQILELRRYIGDVDEPYTYTDAQLDQMIQTHGDVRTTAHTVWLDRAASYAELVDISEAGSSRKNSQLYKNAMEQADRFAPEETAPGGIPMGPVSRPISRG